MQKALDSIRKVLGENAPEVAIVLGSGLGEFARTALTNPRMLEYSQIEGFQTSTVSGHRGRFVLGEIAGRSVVCMQGRLHYYEGYTQQEITAPIRLLGAWGVKTLVVTNAAGGIRDDLSAGSFMLIEDHLNFTGTNPLIGACPPELKRFPDMSHAYDPELLAHAQKVAQDHAINMAKGIYIGVCGPSFETPAEIRAFRTLGADAVGMSTVAEVIVANQLSMRVLGISLISNRAAGLGGDCLTEEEVNETAQAVKEPFEQFLAQCVSTLPL